MSKKLQSLLTLGLVIGILVFLNILSGVFYGIIDLTEDKRFTLTEKTIELLGDIDEPVYIRVLLDGDFPAGFKRLQRSTLEMLNDLRSHSGYIEWEFQNPSEGTKEEVAERYKKLYEDGIQGRKLFVGDASSKKEEIIFPYAIISYKGRTKKINLLEAQMPGSVGDPILAQEQAINKSINLLEYKFANALRIVQRTSKPIVAYLQGHGELNELQVKDFTNTMRPHYEVGFFELDSNYQVPSGIDMLIIAKPTQRFDDKEKFKIDQYIMNGGRVMWLIDRIDMNLDSMGGKPFFVPRDYDLNLEDILFNYGVRIKPNLVLDKQSSPIPQVVGYEGGKPQQSLFDWYYHPLLTGNNNHPVSKGIGLVNMQFPSSLDTTVTIKAPIRREVLLSTSDYSKEQFLPLRVSFDILQQKPNDSWFNAKNIPVAMLYEGEFPSFFTNRIDDDFKATLKQIDAEFKPTSVPNRMIVISDGDIIKNLVTPDQSYMPLGFNQFSRQLYDNKSFLLNAVEHLMDDEGFLEARTKTVKLRLLNQTKAQAEKAKWQWINLLIPVVILLIWGLGWNYIRRRKYAQN